MLEFSTQLTHSLLRQFVPSYRFLKIQADTIDRHHVHHTALESSSITVLNWNIAKNNHDRQWLKDFRSMVRHYRPDLIFLQEVRFDLDAAHAVDLPDMSWSYAPNFIDAHHRAYSGVLTAAKTNPIQSRALVTEHFEPIVQTPKVSLVTEYSLSHRSQTLLAINSHLINFVDLQTFRTQLRDLEQAIATHQGPIIFAGDFNTWSGSRSTALEQAATRLGLQEASFSPDDYRKIKRFLLSPPLDYIFYKQLREHRVNARVLHHITSSDHKPLLTEFSC